MIQKFTALFFVAILCIASYNVISYGTSAPPTASTNAPGESNCTSCHSGSLITSGSDWNNINLSSNFTGNGYLPDSVYTIKVSHSQSGISKWGFEATVLDAANKAIGTMGTVSSYTRVGKTTSAGRDYVYHNGTSGTSSTGTNTVDWLFTWKAPSKNSGNVKFYVTVNSANGNGQDNGDQIFAKNFTIAPSSLIPVANATSKDSVTCAGNTITLNGSSTQNATSWAWTLPGGSPTSSTSQNPSVKYNNPGTYWAILVSKNSKAASKADSLKIVVNAKPSASIIPAIGTYTICKGDSVKLTCTTTGVSYLWSPLGATTATAWAKDTGNYTVTTTNSNKCSNTSGVIRIVHNPVYSLSLTRDVNNDTICFEKPIKVTATEKNNKTTFDSIFYYSGNSLYQKTANNPQIHKFSTSTDLSARGKDSKGCLTAMSNKFDFVVKKGVGTPVLNCAGKTSASFEISWSSVSNALGYKVSLDSGKTWVNPNNGSLGHQVLGFPPNTDVQVWVKALDAFPCYESEIAKIVCGTIPCSPVTYDLVWDKDVCKSNTINFKIINLNTSKYSVKIDNAGPFKDTVFKITSDFSRTYHFELIDSTNLTCPTIKRDAAVKVWEIPVLQLSSNSAQNIFCEESTAIFSVESKGMQEYNFFLNSKSVQKSNAEIWKYPNPKNLDSVWVTVTNGACVQSSFKTILGVKPLPSAAFTYQFTKHTAKFTPVETGSATFKWSFGDGSKDTVIKNPIHTYAVGPKSVWVKLTVIDDFGCIKIDSMLLQIPASVQNQFEEMGIKVYPQPANQVITMEVPDLTIRGTLYILDATGRTLKTVHIESDNLEISVQDLSNGLYLLHIENQEFRANGKIIVQH